MNRAVLARLAHEHGGPVGGAKAGGRQLVEKKKSESGSSSDAGRREIRSSSRRRRGVAGDPEHAPAAARGGRRSRAQAGGGTGRRSGAAKLNCLRSRRSYWCSWRIARRANGARLRLRCASTSRLAWNDARGSAAAMAWCLSAAGHVDCWVVPAGRPGRHAACYGPFRACHISSRVPGHVAG